MMQDEAYVYCKNLDSRARLVELHNVEDMEYLKAIIEGGEFSPVYFWLGGSDRGLEGFWTWENTKEIVAEFVWSTEHNQPNEGFKGNCMYWHFDYDSAADWSCTSPSLYPLCQIPI